MFLLDFKLCFFQTGPVTKSAFNNNTIVDGRPVIFVRPLARVLLRQSFPSDPTALSPPPLYSRFKT